VDLDHAFELALQVFAQTELVQQPALGELFKDEQD
jgi:hypothetical protein